MNVGDAVRVKHPTGGILAEHSFRVQELPNDPDGWVVIRGDIGGQHGERDFRFHRCSLEVIGAAPVDVSAVHPATQHRARVEADLKRRIEQWGEAKILHRQGALTKEALVRTEGLVEQALQNFRDACYAELDDQHGLGKTGLDTARELIEDAVWFPLNRMSAGDRKDDAWLVSDDKVRSLAQAIGMEEEL